MRRILMFVVVVGLLATPPAVLAQGDALAELKNTTPEQRATVQTGFMKEKLGLSKEQAEKVAAINLEFAKKSDPVIKGDEGMFKKMRLLRADRDAKQAALSKVLSREQDAKLAASREEMRERMKKLLADRP